MPRNICINGQEILPGQNVQTRLLVSRLPSGTVIDIPVYVYRALEDGPVLLLMAGMHGDEVNGIETIRRMIRGKMLYPQRGTIIASQDGAGISVYPNSRIAATAKLGLEG